MDTSAGTCNSLTQYKDIQVSLGHSIRILIDMRPWPSFCVILVYLELECWDATRWYIYTYLQNTRVRYGKPQKCRLGVERWFNENGADCTVTSVVWQVMMNVVVLVMWGCVHGCRWWWWWWLMAGVCMMQIRKLRRELEGAKDKVTTLTTQLTTNVSHLFCIIVCLIQRRLFMIGPWRA